MSYREIGGAKVYRAWKEWDEGDVVEGIYLDQTQDNYNKPNYAIGKIYQ